MSTTVIDDESGWGPEDPDAPGGRMFSELEAMMMGIDPPEDRDYSATGEVFDFCAGELEDITIRGRMLVARQWEAMAEALRGAAESPEPWCGPDLSLDPLWQPPRKQTVGEWRARRREMAVRAAAAELAVRTRLSEDAVRLRVAQTEVLLERCPRLWTLFAEGLVSEQNATRAAEFAQSLPADAEDCWAAFDEQISAVAPVLPPGKFRVKARAIRERVHAESLEERHRRAVADRNVTLTPELDGMAFLGALLPAARAQALYGTIDANARHLRGQDGEERTLAQLRADVLADLVGYVGAGGAAGQGAGAAGDPGAVGAPGAVGSPGAAGALGVAAAGAGVEGAGAGGADAPDPVRWIPPEPAVAVTVPVMTLLGRSDEPATLDGYGPIDADTARELAAGATSWIRILTHPITGVPLTLDRSVYRVPKALRRWLAVRDQVCPWPGCLRSARHCQVDHRDEWQYGGTSDEDNLDPPCSRHHPVKTETRWDHRRDPESGELRWISPSGLEIPHDPPPF